MSFRGSSRTTSFLEKFGYRFPGRPWANLVRSQPQPFVELESFYFKGVKTLSLVRISAGSFVMGVRVCQVPPNFGNHPRPINSSTAVLRDNSSKPIGSRKDPHTSRLQRQHSSPPGHEKTESSQEDVRMELFSWQSESQKESFRKWRSCP